MLEIEKRGPPRLQNDDDAKDAARKSIAQNGMAEWRQCVLLKNPKLEVQSPILVQERGDEEGGPPRQTYIVPYGIKDDYNERGTPFTRLCILLDRETGEFEEVVVFGTPVTYLSKQEALNIVALALHLPPADLIDAEAMQIFEPGAITHARSYPFWKIVTGQREYFVDQEGKFYDQLVPRKGGA
jgi:hypothetical protein